ncbi:MAG: hypothetical protein BroJett013_09350 [Alphaproteobacteria bacterium]|nr:MAG: hypothetical protein BroJett013_09350 [Alphaproteobacteria bacterium]
MKAFKFRSSTNLEFALDVIVNRRLFCADWRKLNDPMEGLFKYSSKLETYAEERVKGIGQAKSQYKVCSLSADFQSHLLWSHYAGGFDGLAIEVDLPDHSDRIRPLEYRDVYAFLDMDLVTDERVAAEKILFSKYREWEYEKEIRILHQSEWYPLERPIPRVIVGHRMKDVLVDTLATVCDREEIELCKVRIDDSGIGVERIECRIPRRKRRGRP